MARARFTDPWTSHAAAASVSNLNRKQAEVLKVFQRYGRMTDENLLKLYASLDGQVEPQSDSGLRTRRRELADKGLIRAVGKTQNDRGRTIIVWGLIDAVKEQLELL